MAPCAWLAYVASGVSDGSLSDAELLHVRDELVSCFHGKSTCDAEIASGWALLLNAWRVLGQMTADVDSNLKLPQLLQAGVPTNISQPICFSGV